MVLMLENVIVLIRMKEIQPSIKSKIFVNMNTYTYTSMNNCLLQSVL